MNDQSELIAVRQAGTSDEALTSRGDAEAIEEHIVEIVSDSGEGAQKCGQSFGAVSARMGNGVWTVEIIPAEIQPPARTPDGASGIRIRVGSKLMTNMGNEADFVVAFNEQVLLSRIASGAYKQGTIVLIDDMWASDPLEDIRQAYAKALEYIRGQGLIVQEVPIQRECLKLVEDPRKGKNMFVLGMLCHIYNRDPQKGLDEITSIFAKKSDAVIKSNHVLFRAGFLFARESIVFHYDFSGLVVTDKNMGVM
ncbi:MAG: 2-oxoacid:acceptor oxidoreductase family protein, partial [Pseudomonadales bacterium]|nr:2-oxoacid:acceptor oxidoreductase family protein [Pseudomonadales bacterium]